MKYLPYTLFFLTALCLFGSCKKSEIELYSSGARIQLLDSVTATFSFVYEPKTVVRDTFFLDVRTIGGLTDYDRAIKLEQVPEYRDSIVFNPVTKLPIDTIKLAVPNQAQAGVHYVPFDSPEMKQLLVMKKGEVVAKLPIILIRDASLQNVSYRLRLALVANDDFALGETKSLVKTLSFSDRLERFYSWRFDNGTVGGFVNFGKYSTAKHQFMYDVIGEPIDEAWYQAIVLLGAQQHYKNLIKQALVVFNSDPANIASGKAPLREGGPGSLAVTFP